tara:strand:- start:285 stop:398 length:114 start_codon:yes stop_codon:yes gene_type:complete
MGVSGRGIGSFDGWANLFLPVQAIAMKKAAAFGFEFA